MGCSTSSTRCTWSRFGRDADAKFGSKIEVAGRSLRVGLQPARRLRSRVPFSANGALSYQPGAMLGICSWSVERHITLKERLLPGCHYHLAALHGNHSPKSLIEAVRSRRIALKMTLRDFATAIGRSMYSVSSWENGHSIPRTSTRRLLVDWLGFDPEAISPSP